MSAFLKCLIAICAVLCFMHVTEMARVPRDDGAAAESTTYIDPFINIMINKIRTALEDDKLKEIFADTEGFNKTIQDARERLIEFGKTMSAPMD